MSLQSAYSAYQTRQMDRAESEISQHLSTRPDDSGAQQLGALIALSLGDLPKAMTRIQAALRDPANAHEKLNTQGNILRAAGDEVAAQSCFETAIETKPDYGVARYNLARLLIETAQPRKAAVLLERLVQKEADNETAWRALVNAWLDGNELEKSEKSLAASPLPELEKAFLHGKISFYRDQYEIALKQLESSLPDPQVGGSSLSLMLQILHMTGRWENAGELVETVLAGHPKRSDLFAAAAQAMLRSGNLASAEDLLAKAPSSTETDLVQMDVLMRHEAFSDAKTLALTALKSTPGNHAIMQRVCHSALASGDFDLAQYVADASLRMRPNNQSCYAIKATAGRAKGQDYRYYFDYERFVRPYDLDAPDGWADMSAFNADLKAELNALHGFQHAPLDQTLRLGTQTSPNLKYVESPAIRGFFEAVAPAILRYLSEIGHDPRHAFLRRNRGGYQIRSAWSVRLGSGGHHVNHIHPEGWISSAYYVDVPEGAGTEGWIKFGEPPAPFNTALGQGPEHEVEPKAGRLVLFPSYLWHGTYPITGDKTRLTLPIDILPAQA